MKFFLLTVEIILFILSLSFSGVVETLGDSGITFCGVTHCETDDCFDEAVDRGIEGLDDCVLILKKKIKLSMYQSNTETKAF